MMHLIFNFRDIREIMIDTIIVENIILDKDTDL